MNRSPGLVQWGEHVIRLPPGWGAMFDSWFGDVDRPNRLFGVKQPAELEGDQLQCANGGTQPVDTYFSIEHSADLENVDDAAHYAAAGILAAMLHEVIEWVTVDGVRLADPHPSTEDQWDWTFETMLKVLTEYRSNWPESAVR